MNKIYILKNHKTHINNFINIQKDIPNYSSECEDYEYHFIFL